MERNIVSAKIPVLLVKMVRVCGANGGDGCFGGIRRRFWRQRKIPQENRLLVTIRKMRLVALDAFQRTRTTVVLRV